jgi:hypothetical protein
VSQNAGDLLVLLVGAEADAAPARVRLGVFRAMGGTTIQIDNVELAASVADQDSRRGAALGRAEMLSTVRVCC